MSKSKSFIIFLQLISFVTQSVRMQRKYPSVCVLVRAGADGALQKQGGLSLVQRGRISHVLSVSAMMIKSKSCASARTPQLVHVDSNLPQSTPSPR